MKTLSFSITLSFFFAYQIVVGQIEISTGPDITPEDMVEKIVGEGIIYDNVQFQGADISSGIFSNGLSTNLGLESGVFLTSGAGNIIPGPNNSGNAGVNNGLGGHPTLNAMSIATTYDAAVLEFDLVPGSDTLRFKFVFGSEEYPEAVGSSSCDVFGIFITGPNPMGGYYSDKNICTIPGTTTAVGINTINNTSNPEYFVDNANGSSLQYDGLTIVMEAKINVIACETYSIKLGIADAGDHVYDSGVFLEENSITSPSIEIEAILDPPDISDQMVEGCVHAEIIFKLPDASYAPFTLYWDLSESTANPGGYPPGDFEADIPDYVVFQDGVDSVSITINPVADEIIEGEESLVFMLENTLGCYPLYDTIIFPITDYIEMTNSITPSTVICEDMQIQVSVQVENGIPPYSYFWEPGGFTTDSILVMPDSSTNYYVTYSDMCQNSGMDSTSIIVFPVCDFETFYFDSALNPGLPYAIYGEVSNDTVLIVFPSGTNLTGLIASFTTDLEGCIPTVNSVIQESGVTVNDFTEPLVYHFWGPGGCFSEWTVIADVETRLSENFLNSFSVYPNPANDLLTVSFDQPCELSIINSLGQTVFNEQVKAPKRNIDLSEFNEGLYFLQVKNDHGLIVRKVIISR